MISIAAAVDGFGTVERRALPSLQAAVATDLQHAAKLRPHGISCPSANVFFAEPVDMQCVCIDAMDLRF
jgi:hypothetical protein